MARAGFRSELLHRFRRGPDKRERRGRTSARERGILGEKAVAGMHGIAARAAGGAQHVVDREITLARGRGADAIGFVGQAHVQRSAVDVAVDRHGANAQFAAGAQDAHGDLTAIGDQDLLEHVILISVIVCGYRQAGRKQNCQYSRSDYARSVAAIALASSGRAAMIAASRIEQHDSAVQWTRTSKVHGRRPRPKRRRSWSKMEWCGPGNRLDGGDICGRRSRGGISQNNLRVSGIPTSEQTAELARRLKVPLTTFAAALSNRPDRRRRG